MAEFDVYIGIEYIETVSYDEKMSEEEVRHDLINKHVYTTKIRVVKKG